MVECAHAGTRTHARTHTHTDTHTHTHSHTCPLEQALKCTLDVVTDTLTLIYSLLHSVGWEQWTQTGTALCPVLHSSPCLKPVDFSLSLLPVLDSGSHCFRNLESGETLHAGSFTCPDPFLLSLLVAIHRKETILGLQFEKHGVCILVPCVTCVQRLQFLKVQKSRLHGVGE